MKLNLPEVKVEREGITTEVMMGIDEANQHIIMNMLRSQIYSNPLGSAVREILSNAIDAHVAAGCEDVPIEIVLPNAFQDKFIVRDYGHSMSPDSIKTVYAMLGTSSKRDSDKQIGCYGLGAVSPLSYTDSFTVETNTVEDGRTVKRVWLEYIDESLMGKLSLMSEEETEDKPGTVISIPIKNEDVGVLRSHVNKYSNYLPIPPLIDGNPYKPVEVPILARGASWVWYEEQNLYSRISLNSSDKAEVVMGGIPYPISCKDLNIEDNLRLLVKFKIVVFLPIGGITLTANREALQYTDKTISSIRDALLLVRDEANKEATKNLELIDNLYEVSKKYFGFYDDVRTALGPIKWNGITLSHLKYEVPNGYKLQTFYQSRDWVSGSYVDRIKGSNPDSIEILRKDAKFYINDLGSKVVNREIVKKLIEGMDDPLTYLYIFSYSDPKEEPEDKLERFKPIKLSILYPQFIPTPKKRSKGMVDALRYTPESSRSHTSGAYSYFIPERIDKNGEGVYALVKNGRCELTHLHYFSCNRADPNLIKAVGLNELIGIRPTIVDKLGPNWILFQDRVNQLASEIEDAVDLAPDIRDVKRWFDTTCHKLKDVGALVKEMREDSIARQYISHSQYLSSLMRDRNRDFILISNSEMTKTDKPSKVGLLFEAFISKYPMIELLLRSYIAGSDYDTQILSYINLIDSN